MKHRDQQNNKKWKKDACYLIALKSTQIVEKKLYFFAAVN